LRNMFPLAALLSLAFAVPAQGLEDQLWPGDMILSMAEELELSKAQVSKIEGILLECEKARIQREAERKLAEVELRAMLRSEKIDREKLRKQVEKIGRLDAQLKLIDLEGMLDVKAVLTPEQIEKVKAIKKERMKMKRMEKGRRIRIPGEPGPPPGPHPFPPLEEPPPGPPPGPPEP